MLRHKYLSYCPVAIVLILITAASAGAQAKAQSPTAQGVLAAQRLFRHGKQLIEDNCIDCQGGTRGGLEDGIKEVQQSIEDGYPQRKAAYKLLAEAYGYMTTYTQKNPEEQRIYAAKQLEVKRKLFELYPNDPAILQSYQESVENDDERIQILKKLVKIASNRPDASFDLGFLLIKKKQFKDGLESMKSAIAKQPDPEAVMNYVQRLLGELEEQGCPLTDANQWQQKVSAAWDKATMGAGDANAMPEFKKGFLESLDHFSCGQGSSK